MPTAETFTDEQLEEFKQAFYAFDDDGGVSLNLSHIATF